MRQTASVRAKETATWKSSAKSKATMSEKEKTDQQLDKIRKQKLVRKRRRAAALLSEKAL